MTGLTLERLEGLAFSGAGLQLRLQISALGVVESVEVLRVQPGDEAFAQALAQLLRDTPHVPARRDGRDVASVKTVWFGRGPLPEPERAYPVAR
ncbi:hypothetical protein [Ideonella livida]|uniref:TonB C-terminal domain-containing protein n=1 Tax=Ideonella livida TaxID=2707176 RepID=A0A7C9PHS1_9BURK|nr:hypothetical protein [Ideonella livida]NDY92089.1 hypothetical protein [Ideonella livida]